MRQGITALIVGVMFGLGLAVSGMTQPQKVVGFLDFMGSWDPSLAFVMVGAILIHSVAYRFVLRRSSPFLAPHFLIPDGSMIDRRLIVGSVLFGMGWGLAGYCPGPALASIVALKTEIFVFLLAMTSGMYLHVLFERVQSAKALPVKPETSF